MGMRPENALQQRLMELPRAEDPASFISSIVVIGGVLHGPSFMLSCDYLSVGINSIREFDTLLG